MSWPLSRLQIEFVSVLFVSILLPVAQRRRRREHWRRVQQQREAALIASRFDLGVYAYRGAGTHANP